MRATSLGVLLSAQLLLEYALACSYRLRRLSSREKKPWKSPSLEELQSSLHTVFRVRMFGSAIDEMMRAQAMLLPERQLPWILTSLTEAILRAGGAQSEGILRLSADADAVQTLKARCEQWQTLLRPLGELRTDPHAPVIPFECSDPHVLAGVLKLWLRELREPLVSPQLYEQCIAAFADAERCRGLLESLPLVQRASLTYLVRFLQLLALPQNAERSKMDATNLATVIAPNILRRPADASDSLATDPARALEDARREMHFVANLIRTLDCSGFDAF